MATHDRVVAINAGFMATHGVFMATHDGSMVTHDAFLANHDDSMATHDGFMATHDAFLANHDGSVATHDDFMAAHDAFLANHDGSVATHDSTEACPLKRAGFSWGGGGTARQAVAAVRLGQSPCGASWVVPRSMGLCHHSRVRKIFLCSLIVLGSLLTICGQEKADLPDRVMKQVVSRIVRYYFKPLHRPRSVFVLDKGIKGEWLPKIPGRQFVLLTEADLQKHSPEVFFFRSPDAYRNHFRIGFGYGYPSCNSDGHMWEFRLDGDRVRLWLPHDRGWGWACVD